MKTTSTLLIFFAFLLVLTGCKDDNTEPGKKPSLGIEQELEGSGPYSIIVKFTPDNNTEYVNYAISPESDKFGFQAGTMEGYSTKRGNSEFTVTFDDLEPGTPYYIYGQAFNSELAGDIVEKIFTTREIIAGEPSIAITVVEIGSRSVVVTFTPSEASGYRYAVGTASQESSFADGSMEGIQTVNNATESTLTISDLQPETEYTIFAVAFNDTEESEVVSTTVSTKSPGVRMRIRGHVMTGSMIFEFDPEVAEAELMWVERYVWKQMLEYGLVGEDLSSIDVVELLSDMGGGMILTETTEIDLALYECIADIDLYFLCVSYDSNGVIISTQAERLSTPARDPDLPVPGPFRYVLESVRMDDPSDPDLINAEIWMEVGDNTYMVFTVDTPQDLYEDTSITTMSVLEIMDIVYDNLSPLFVFDEWNTGYSLLMTYDITEDDMPIYSIGFPINENGVSGSCQHFIIDLDYEELVGIYNQQGAILPMNLEYDPVDSKVKIPQNSYRVVLPMEIGR